MNEPGFVTRETIGMSVWNPSATVRMSFKSREYWRNGRGRFMCRPPVDDLEALLKDHRLCAGIPEQGMLEYRRKYERDRALVRDAARSVSDYTREQLRQGSSYFSVEEVDPVSEIGVVRDRLLTAMGIPKHIMEEQQ